MKILFLNPVGTLGGAERSLLELISIIRKARPDWQIDVLLGDEGPLELAASELGVHVCLKKFPYGLKVAGDSGFRGSRKWLLILCAAIKVPFQLYQIWRYTVFLKDFIKKRNPQIVHSNGFKYHLLTGLFKLTGVKFVWHVRDYVTSRLIAGKCIRWFCSKPDVVVANSYSVLNDWKKLFHPSTCIVLYNTVDDRVFNSCGQRKKLPLLPLHDKEVGQIIVGFVASFARWKGQLLFIKAIELVMKNRRHSQVSFCIVGGPIYSTNSSQYSLAELQSYVNELGLSGIVHFIPHQRDMPEIYQALDIVVHASTEPEPFGRTIVEAMACGIPVVAAMDGGVLEIVQDGINGLGFRSGYSDNLAAKIELLLGDASLRVRLGSAGRKFVHEHFSRDALSDQVVDFYDCLNCGKV